MTGFYQLEQLKNTVELSEQEVAIVQSFQAKTTDRTYELLSEFPFLIPIKIKSCQFYIINKNVGSTRLCSSKLTVVSCDSMHDRITLAAKDTHSMLNFENDRIITYFVPNSDRFALISKNNVNASRALQFAQIVRHKTNWVQRVILGLSHDSWVLIPPPQMAFLWLHIFIANLPRGWCIAHDRRS